jgi:hypothetical protein
VQWLEGLKMFRKKQTDPLGASLGPGAPIGSFVLLERESFTVDSFLKQLAATCVAGKTASDIKRDEGLFSFKAGDEFFACLRMKVPFPGDLEGPIATTWLWP